MKELTIKELRLKNKLTQEQVAEKSGYSKDYISMLERGERNPSDKAKKILASIYNVSVVQFFLSIQRTKSTMKDKEKEVK
ncbi:MAG: helix-turn-helix transcriptional regulator [Clostridia bacterium]|nr:helix-turn-helix transcriptional regulator [Clostridia bacterium]